jgi:two-component system nitrate/nitrite response regulator NarL
MRNNGVLIATNSDFLAEALRDIVRDAGGGLVVTARSEGELTGRIQKCFPRLVLLENCFRQQGTEELVMRLVSRNRDLRIAVWSPMAVQPVIAARFILAGAESYFSLRGGEDDVAEIVGRIAAGRRYCPAGVQAVINSGTYFPNLTGKLTAREREVVKLSATGGNNRAIAEALGITVSTLKLHKVNIYRKCGGNTVVDMLRYGLKQGVIRPEDLGEC